MIRRLFFELLYLLKKANWDTGISPPELIEFLEDHPPGRALDLGCGTGTNVLTMAQFGWEAVGIDISSLAINKARQKAESAGVNTLFFRGDVTELNNISGTFDLILDIGCLHTISAQTKIKYAENLDKLLRPEGTFLLYTWLQQEMEGDEIHTPEDKIIDLFSLCCECINLDRGIDSASDHRSGWFTFKRTS